MEVIIKNLYTNGSSEEYTATQPVTPETDDLDADLRREARHRRTPEFDSMLLDENANPAAVDLWGYNALLEAITAKHTDAVMSLVHRKDIKKIINTKTQGMNGEEVTPLFCALFENSSTPDTLKITRLLLEHGANVDQDLLLRIGASCYNNVDDERNMIVRAYDLADRLSDNIYAPILTTLWKEGKERLSKPKLDALITYDNNKRGCLNDKQHQLLEKFTHDFADILSAVKPAESYKASSRIVPGGRY